MMPRGECISYMPIYSRNFAKFMRKIVPFLLKTSLVHFMLKIMFLFVAT